MLSFSTFAVSAALLSTSVQTLYRRLGCSCRKAREQTYQHAQRIKIGKTDWLTYLLLHVVTLSGVLISFSACLDGLYAFVFLSTVLRCLDSHLSSKWTRFRLRNAYAATQQTEFASPFCLVTSFVLKITSRSKRNQLPWLGHAKCMQGKEVKFNLPK